VVRKNKTNLFHDQVEPKLTERRLKIAEALRLVAVISFAVFIACLILHDVLLGDLLEIIGGVAICVSIIAMAAWLYFFLTGRQKTK
jgi:hypothetical protein